MKYIPRTIHVTVEDEGIIDSMIKQLSTPEHPSLGFYKITPNAYEPVWGTDHAACFDLKACLVAGDTVNSYNAFNEKNRISVQEGSERPFITISPNSRVLVPTGLIFDIPVGYSVRLHSRSGLALKQGLVLANHEGIVDSDYTNQTYVLLTNDSMVEEHIYGGDRIAQAEMMRDIAYEILECKAEPLPKTNRTGGFGSTGK